MVVHEYGTSVNPEWDFDLLQSCNPQFHLSCEHGLNLKFCSGLKLNPDSCKLPLTQLCISVILDKPEKHCTKLFA